MALVATTFEYVRKQSLKWEITAVLAKQMESRWKIKVEHVIVGSGLLVSMMVVVGFQARLITNLIGFVYPALCTMALMESANGHWTQTSVGGGGTAAGSLSRRSSKNSGSFSSSDGSCVSDDSPSSKFETGAHALAEMRTRTSAPFSAPLIQQSQSHSDNNSGIDSSVPPGKLWLLYWLLFCGYSVLEDKEGLVVCCVPLYYTVKAIFLLWCMLPQFKGSAFLHLTYVVPLLQRRTESADGDTSTASRSSVSAMSVRVATASNPPHEKHGLSLSPPPASSSGRRSANGCSALPGFAAANDGKGVSSLMIDNRLCVD